MIFILLRKIVPFVLAVSAFALLVVEPRYPFFTLLALPIWIAAAALGFAILAGHEGRHSAFWLLLAPLVVIFSSAVFFLLIVDNAAVHWIFTIVPPIGIALFSYTLYLFVQQPARYQPYALEHLSLILNLCSFFLLSASFLGYAIFLSLPQWTVVVGLFGLAGLLMAETMWVSKVPSERQPLLVFLGSLLMAEAAVAALLLPTSFLVGGAILALAYYTLTGLFRSHALGSLDARVMWRYAGISVLSVLVVLITARWT